VIAGGNDLGNLSGDFGVAILISPQTIARIPRLFMNCVSPRCLCFAVIAWCAPVVETRAHDFFDSSPAAIASGVLGPVRPTEFTRTDRLPTGLPLTAAEEAQLRDQYNFAIGPIRFALAGGFGVEWNDNITFAERHRHADFIARPSVELDAAWPMTELNTLRFALGIGYAKYFEHAKFDSDALLVSPDSKLEWKVEVGAVELVVRDRFSDQEDPSEIPQLSNVAAYRRAENRVELMTTWAANDSVKVSGGYDHYDLRTMDDEFSSEDRAMDTFFFRPCSQLTPNLSVGLDAALSLVTFDRGERADGTSLFIGPSIEWKMTENTRVRAEGGLQRLDFEGASNFDRAFFASLEAEERALFRDDHETTTAYFRFEVAHRPSDGFEQVLAASKTAEIGFGSNFYDLFHVEYRATYKGFRGTEIGPAIFYEFYEGSGGLSEEASRAGLLLGIRHHVTNALTLGLDYRFLWKDSNVEELSYYQNLVFVSVQSRF
jgi:hypothetical protein